MCRKNKNKQKMETNQNHSKSCKSFREFVALRRKLETEKDIGVNFINVFKRNFYARRSRKRKKQLEMTFCAFALLGSASIKAARKMLVRLTPGGEGGREREREG